MVLIDFHLYFEWCKKACQQASYGLRNNFAENYVLLLDLIIVSTAERLSVLPSWCFYGAYPWNRSFYGVCGLKVGL
jgi:hypothetical protein